MGICSDETRGCFAFSTRTSRHSTDLSSSLTSNSMSSSQLGPGNVDFWVRFSSFLSPPTAAKPPSLRPETRFPASGVTLRQTYTQTPVRGGYDPSPSASYTLRLSTPFTSRRRSSSSGRSTTSPNCFWIMLGSTSLRESVFWNTLWITPAIPGTEVAVTPRKATLNFTSGSSVAAMLLRRRYGGESSNCISIQAGNSTSRSLTVTVKESGPDLTLMRNFACPSACHRHLHRTWMVLLERVGRTRRSMSHGAEAPRSHCSRESW
mmetsp:Transcript_6551/g.15348  ORF Transcript_6551/g.15348 Transcript_6551/m.15348 type:complete len:263 (-) Transcript_6551:761-1549(-)